MAPHCPEWVALEATIAQIARYSQSALACASIWVKILGVGNVNVAGFHPGLLALEIGNKPARLQNHQTGCCQILLLQSDTAKPAEASRRDIGQIEYHGTQATHCGAFRTQSAPGARAAANWLERRAFVSGINWRGHGIWTDRKHVHGGRSWHRCHGWR